MTSSFVRSLLCTVVGLCVVTTGAWAQSAPGAASAAAPAPAPPSAEAFFLPGRLRQAVLSPSGRWLAAVAAGQDERARLIVTDLEDREPALVVAAFSKFDVQNAQWVNDDLLVFGINNPEDQSSNALRAGEGLLSVQRDGQRLRLLVKREWDTDFPAPGNAPLEANHSLLALGPEGSDDLVLGEWMFDAADEFRAMRLLRLNARTGARSTLIDDAPAQVRGWWFDHQGQPRVAVSNADGQTTVHWRETPGKGWRTLAKAPALDLPWWPAFVDGDGQLFVTRSNQRNEGQLLRLNLETGQPVAEPLASIPGFSPNFSEMLDRRSGELMGLQVVTDARSQVWLTPAMQAAQAKANATLPGRINLVSCGRCDSPRRVLVYSYSDRHPGEYLLLDLTTDKWLRLGTRGQNIAPEHLGSMDFHRIKARDGADLPVWVTMPPGAAKKARPAVVLVHGGPWSRGAAWGWDAEAQFLASRGYVVIQPEFRGSTGYGHDHFRAGFRQWGQRMQDDVTDALRHAVDKGWVDPQRVCIAGGSYGGYSTLMGLAKDPSLYRCGVAWVAVTDPRLMFSVHWSDISRDSKQFTMPQMIGDPDKDAEMLAANSPLALARRIKAPVMLTYGALDRRVPLTHGEQMRSALTQAGNPPEWHVYGDEGHSWRRPSTEVDFWRRVETFLARHLGP